MKKLLLILASCLCFGISHAQSDSLKLKLPAGLSAETYTNEFLDTLNIKKKLVINDYSMIGINYGVNLSQVMWSRSLSQDMLVLPTNIGITYTKYGKMFGYMPYFGFQIGLTYTQEGYQFEYNEEKDFTNIIDESMGAEKAIYDVIELPMSFHFHYDLWNFKIIGNIGCYGGYRVGIHRYPGVKGSVAPGYENSFAEHDRRFDYGIKGGVGFGLVFDPVEFHLMASYKYSFGTLYQPDYFDKVFYIYAYPANLTISAGVHFHLSKRTGKTKAELKRMAKEMVYENISAE